jgi:hypothetical protein
MNGLEERKVNMANVTNKLNPMDYRRSVNEGDYDPTEWVIHDTIEDIEKVEAIPLKYRKILSNKVAEMTQTQKTAVDQAEADAVLQAEQDEKDITKADPRLKGLALVVGDLHNKTGSEIKNLVEQKL